MYLFLVFIISFLLKKRFQVLIIGLGISGCLGVNSFSGYLTLENGELWLVNALGKSKLVCSDSVLQRYVGYHLEVKGKRRNGLIQVQEYHVDMDSTRVKLKGRLIMVAGIGGETTGFALLLSSPFSFQDQVYESFEVYSLEHQLESRVERLVEVEGVIEWREGVERGRYPVLRIESLREIHY